MTWEYRVMSNAGELAIYSVYYYEGGDKDGQVEGYSRLPSHPVGETIQDLRADCALYLKALEKPILEYEG